MKRRNGEHIGSFAAYGYIKDPNDKNALVVDEEAAAVVRDIFNKYLDGMSKKRHCPLSERSRDIKPCRLQAGAPGTQISKSQR